MSAEYPTWSTSDGDITISCPPCGLTCRYRDTVDDGLAAQALWRVHANHEPDDDDAEPTTPCQRHQAEGEPWCSDCWESAEAEARGDREREGR